MIGQAARTALSVSTSEPHPCNVSEADVGSLAERACAYGCLPASWLSENCPSRRTPNAGTLGTSHIRRFRRMRSTDYLFAGCRLSGIVRQ